ncbi:unnamed protein product [Caenorhabditis sp. 36 PRJEB53466]|nr:unnamed protein product [Caenorhabditis sp. 36 PRJEB53466]
MKWPRNTMMTHRTPWPLISVIIVVFIVWHTLLSVFRAEEARTETSVEPTFENVTLPFQNSSESSVEEIWPLVDEKTGKRICDIEPWNNVTLRNVSFYEQHLRWARRSIGSQPNLREGKLKIVSAFVYEDHIAVTTTTQNRFGTQVFCRYFDCNRDELPVSVFPSFMFPLSAAYCARRAGAVYVSLTDEMFSRVDEMNTVPIVFRAYKQPVHEISVCFGPVYGEEKRWLEIAEVVEHHRLIGATYFYLTALNDVDAYTNKLLQEYQRVGLADVTVIQSEYKTMDWMFHMLQINECYFRSKQHSKWVLNIDIDERFMMEHTPLPVFLRSMDEEVGEIMFQIRRVQRTEPLPEKYVSTEQLIEDLEFLKYNKTSSYSWETPKVIFRPEKVQALFYHWSWIQYPGVMVANAPRSIGYVRHYRTTGHSLKSDWAGRFGNFTETRLENSFEERLVDAVVKRVERVYAQRDSFCDEIPQATLDLFTNDNYSCVYRNGTRKADLS